MYKCLARAIEGCKVRLKLRLIKCFNIDNDPPRANFTSRVEKRDLNPFIYKGTAESKKIMSMTIIY
ncbi:MAG: hypothetical protein QW738_07565 [Nitrososphaeria archaeon]